MKLILFVLQNINQLETLLQAWEQAGVEGTTVLPSQGLRRVLHPLQEADLTLMWDLNTEHQDPYSRTLFSVVEDDAVVERVVAATRQVVGDLSEPNTGILAVLPLAQVYGLKKKKSH